MKIDFLGYIVCTLISTNQIMTGDNAMVSWGAAINNNYLASDYDLIECRNLMERTSLSFEREVSFSEYSPITVENVWIDFNAIVKPETTIERGSIIGSKSVVLCNIPSYSVVVGNLGRVIIKIKPTDKNNKS
jgi:acetyltransferase-like isoleucine patch superfamily enzyme